MRNVIGADGHGRFSHNAISTINGLIPASFAQAHTWQIALPSGGTQRVAVGFHLSEVVHPDRLAASLNELVARHDWLRTITITNASGHQAEKLLPHVEIPLPVINLSHFSKSDRETAVSLFLKGINTYPFDPATGRLIYTELLQLAKDEFVWLIALHHAISDQWLIQNLLLELTEIYRAAEPTEPEQPIRHEMAPFRAIVGHQSNLIRTEQQLWLIEKQSGGSFVNHQAEMFRINQAINTDALSQAVRALTDNHPLFRTAFVEKQGIPQKELFNAVKNPLEIVDLSHLAPSDASAMLAQRSTSAFRRPFLLHNAPLCRIVLFKHAPQQYTLLLIVHHIVLAQWDDTLIYDQLPIHYQAFTHETAADTLQIKPLDAEELPDPDAIDDAFNDELAAWLEDSASGE